MHLDFIYSCIHSSIYLYSSKILPQVCFFFRTATTSNTAEIRSTTKPPAVTMMTNEPENIKHKINHSVGSHNSIMMFM